MWGINMAKCGIKKYDELPGRVGWIDVDYLRYEFAFTEKRLKKIKSMLEKARKKESGT